MMRNSGSTIIFYFQYANECFDFFRYAKKAKENMKIYENSLEFTVSVDTAVLFDNHKYIYTKNDLLAKLLYEKIEDFRFRDEQAEEKELDLLALIRFTDDMMLSIYAMPVRPEIEKIEDMVGYITEKYFTLVGEKFKDQGKNKIAMIKLILNYSIEMQQVLKKYGLEDSTLTRLCVILMNINKKSFFNSSAEVINRILDDLETHENLDTIFVDFYKTLNSFVQVFGLFSDFEGFESVLAEFFRRTHIFFLFHLEKIVTNPNMKYNLDRMVTFMNNCLSSRSDNNKFIEQLIAIYPEMNKGWIRDIMNFRMQFARLGRKALEKAQSMMEKDISSHFKECNLENMDLSVRVRRACRQSFKIKEEVNRFYKPKVQKTILLQIMAGFMKCVLSSTDEQISNFLEEGIKSVEDVLEEFVGEFGVEAQKKFLKILFRFFKTSSMSTVEVCLGQLVTLSGLYLHDHTIQALIEAKNYKYTKFNAKKVALKWQPIMMQEKKGLKRKHGAEKRKDNALKYLSILGNVVVFAKKLKFKSRQKSEKNPNQARISGSIQSFQNVRPHKELSVDDYFNKIKSVLVGYFCFKKDSFILKKYGIYDVKKDPEYIMKSVNDQFYSKVFLRFMNQKVYLKSEERNHFIKIILPKKIKKFQLLETRDQRGLYMEYDQDLHMIFKVFKTSRCNFVFQSFNKLINRTLKVKLVPDGKALRDVTREESKKTKSSFLAKLYLLTKYEFKFPKIYDKIKKVSKEDQPTILEDWGIKNFWNNSFGKRKFTLEVGRDVDFTQKENYQYKFDDHLKAYGFNDPEANIYEQSIAKRMVDITQL
jgi:hypothetical protein